MQKALWALLAAPLALFGPAQAQTKIDPEVETFAKALMEAMNSRNADQAVALLSADSVLVDPFGKASTGKEAEREFFETAFKLNPNAAFALTPVALHKNGETIWVLANAGWAPIGNTGAKPVTTHVAYVLVQEGDAWKAQMASVGFNAPQQPGAK
jgi:ketosteroid isomerase-like protein